MRVKALYLISLVSSLVSVRIHQLTQLDEGEGKLYLKDLPSLKLGLCENLLHQLMQLHEGEGIIPDRPP